MRMTAAPHTGLARSRDPLERLLGLVEAPSPPSGQPGVQVAGGRDDRATWLVDRDWRVFAGPAHELVSGGQEIAQFELTSAETLSASFDAARNSVIVPFSPEEAYANYLTEAWKGTGPKRGLSARQLNAFYRVKRFIPRRLQIKARQMLIRREGLPEFPRWPLDSSVSQLLRFYAYCVVLARAEREAELRWFWPESYSAALILTHDVETAEGLPLAVELADLEQEHGFRSTFNLGAWYEVDPGIIRELTERGFEIGMHGLRHDRSLFSSRAAFDAQRPELAKLAARLGAEGFRSPATHRVFDWIGELPISYDGSIPHSDPFEPQPGGCCSLWPFFIGDVVELPYTLPQDYTLFTLLGHRSPALWLEQADRIVDEHGLIHSLSHPDAGYLGDPGKRNCYREFLIALSERKEIWKPLARDLATWWRLRDTAEADDNGVSRAIIRIGESADEVQLIPPAGAEALPSDRR
jgi:peptidoglycan/xylan/chitin deacetylase (PgdA/CDA1 family)